MAYAVVERFPGTGRPAGIVTMRRTRAAAERVAARLGRGQELPLVVMTVRQYEREYYRGEHVELGHQEPRRGCPLCPRRRWRS